MNKKVLVSLFSLMFVALAAVGVSRLIKYYTSLYEADPLPELISNHTYTFDYENFALNNEAEFREANENDTLVIKVSSAIRLEEEQINSSLDNYVGFDASIENIDISSLLYFANNELDINDEGYVSLYISQFTVIELITYTQGNLLSIYPYLTDITE